MKLVRLGMVGVDSASLLITDPMYLGSWDHDDPFSVTEDLNGAHRHPCPPDLPYSLGGATAAHSSESGAGMTAYTQRVEVGTFYTDSEALWEVIEVCVLGSVDLRNSATGALRTLGIDAFRRQMWLVHQPPSRGAKRG